MVILTIILIAILSYLCGSIATSVWLSKLVYHKDVREFGSGNAGATNVYRVFGWKPALLVILVDITKGLIPTLYFSQLRLAEVPFDPVYLQLLAGSAAVMGHVWTVFAQFRGGKGVATLLGMLLGLYPLVLPLCLAVFITVTVTTRLVSLASLSASLSLPITLLIFQFGIDRPVPVPLLVLSFAITAFIFFTHRANIGRLLNGTESKFRFRRGAKSDPSN